MVYNSRPTIRRMLLAGKLSKAREQAGLTVEDVATRLGTHVSSIYRQESGHTAVKVADVSYLAKLYGVTDEITITRWEEWARRSKQRGWWTSFGTKVGPTYLDYADAEDLASELRAWEPLVVPGLLQTREYSETIIRTNAEAHQNSLPIEELMQLRERRKEVLNRPVPPRLWMILGEAALRTEVGGVRVMREQWQHLLNLGERPNLTLQVLPFTAGAHAGVGGSFVVMSFDEDDVVFREGGTTGAFNDEPAEVAVTRTRYSLLQTQALSMSDTRGYLHGLLSQHER